MIKEKTTLGTVTGEDGTQIKVDETFLTTSPYLLDSLYVVSGSSKNESKFKFDINKFIRIIYQSYKPIGVATTGEPDYQALGVGASPGVILNENNPNFGKEFVSAIAQQRFWDRK